jgi:molybdate transport system ATP-binding protein
MITFRARVTRGAFTLDAEFSGDGAVTALFGPSGSGKSTIIHLMAGLIRPNRGYIAAGGRVLLDTDRGLFVPSHKRRVGLVFQDAQLFPHMTVGQNLAFGRWFVAKDRRSIEPAAVLEALGIEALLGRRPAGLSGGEKQRVALARAMLAAPDVLLMDEPLGGLDQDRKDEILPLIERLRDEFAIPIVYVSHDSEEVARLASRVVILKAGRVDAIGVASQFKTVANEEAASQGQAAFRSRSIAWQRPG